MKLVNITTITYAIVFLILTFEFFITGNFDGQSYLCFTLLFLSLTYIMNKYGDESE